MKETGRLGDTGHNFKYEKLINMPYRKSNNRKNMDISERAAQFASFQALSGFGDKINETARLTDRKIELEEFDAEKINKNLQQLISLKLKNIPVTVEYFVPDLKKKGGAYIKKSGIFKRIDEFNRLFVFCEGTAVPIDDIFNIKIEKTEK